MSEGKHFEGLGKALRLIRIRQERSLTEVAETAGITRAMLSGFELERRQPSVRVLDRIMAALDVSLGDLHLVLLEVRSRRA